MCGKSTSLLTQGCILPKSLICNIIHSTHKVRAKMDSIDLEGNTVIQLPGTSRRNRELRIHRSTTIRVGNTQVRMLYRRGLRIRHALIAVGHTVLIRPAEVSQSYGIHDSPLTTRGVLCSSRDRPQRHINSGSINISTTCVDTSWLLEGNDTRPLCRSGRLVVTAVTH